MTSISIAMATYNGSKYIQRQLDSLTAQVCPPTELVVSDDASEDNTVAIVNAFAKTAPFPVHVYKNDARLGYRANFLRATSFCRSELIAFCDQDDRWYPNKIAEAVKPFSDPDVLLTYHNADVVTIEGRRIGSTGARAAHRAIMTPLMSGPWVFALGFTEVFRRSLLQFSGQWPNARDFLGLSSSLGHDQWFFFLASVFGTVVYLDEPLVAYVQHGTSAFGWKTNRSFLQKARPYFCSRADIISNHAKAAESREVILETVKGSIEGVWRERAAAAAEYYRNLSSLCAERSTLYTSKVFGVRLKTFYAILAKGGYSGAWGLGRKSLIADICLGVPIGPLLPR